jgi:GDP-L-fucose synthase
MLNINKVRKLILNGYKNIITIDKKDLDLRNQIDVFSFLKDNKPEYVFLAAAKVGGILSNNKYKADFIYDNLMIQSNIIHNSYLNGVNKLLFLGSSCIYPKFSIQPIKEEYLLDGYLEPTNDAYAIAKIAGIKMCQSYNEQYNTNFISVMPTNLYGPGDNYNLDNAHVIPSIIRKMHEAKINNQESVEIWGTGDVMREFMHVDDLADACLFLMNNYNSSDIINIGTGKDLTIKELSFMIKQVVGYKGNIIFNSYKLEGTPRKILDVSKLNKIGWHYKIELNDGLSKTYSYFLKNIQNLRY